MNTLIFGVSSIALVVGITQVIKKLGMPSKWSPLVAIGAGILIEFIAYGFVLRPEIFIEGIVVGLTACGVWDVGKKTILKK